MDQSFLNIFFCYKNQTLFNERTHPPSKLTNLSPRKKGYYFLELNKKS